MELEQVLERTGHGRLGGAVHCRRRGNRRILRNVISGHGRRDRRDASCPEAYAVESVAEIVEAGTGFNFVRDTIFQGDETAYNISKIVLYTTMEVGSMVLSMGACFIAGTPVATEDGNQPIETIRAGDCVWAWNEETGEVALKQVVETYINETDELIHLTINGEEIVTTPTHPFYVPQKGWTSAAQLRAGDVLVLLNGEYAVLEQIQHELLESPIQVYNFQVEDFHTYYVGDTGVLVHINRAA